MATTSKRAKCKDRTQASHDEELVALPTKKVKEAIQAKGSKRPVPHPTFRAPATSAKAAEIEVGREVWKRSSDAIVAKDLKTPQPSQRVKVRRGVKPLHRSGMSFTKPKSKWKLR